MLFFWHGGFGGLDTLRSFLGHSDPRHVYHYITEASSGAVLNSVKTEFVRNEVLGGTSIDGLLSHVRSKFGVTDLSLVATDTLDSYISDMIEKGSLEVEPIFIDKGERYRILVRLKEPVR